MKTLSDEQKRTAIEDVITLLWCEFNEAEAEGRGSIELRSEIGAKFHARVLEAYEQINQ